MYCVTIFYDDYRYDEFVTKDSEYIKLAVEAIQNDDNVVQINIKFIEVKK